MRQYDITFCFVCGCDMGNALCGYIDCYIMMSWLGFGAKRSELEMKSSADDENTDKNNIILNINPAFHKRSYFHFIHMAYYA